MNIEIHTQVTDVCLYKKGARITRSGKMGCKDKEVVIHGLPLKLDDDSIQIETSDSCYCQSQSVYLKPYDPSKDQKMINKLKLELIGYKSQKASIHSQIIHLQKTLPSNSRDRNNEVDFCEMAEATMMLAEFKDIEIANLHSFEQAIDSKMNKVETEIKQLEKNKDTEKTCTKTLKLCFNFTKQKDASLKIHYLIQDASWCPSYSIDVNSDIKEGNFTLKALACQNSGEDWTNVNMTLSSSLPNQFKCLPELKSLYVGRKQLEEGKSTWKPAPKDTEELFGDHDIAAGISPVQKIKKIKDLPKVAVIHPYTPRVIVLSEIMRGETFDFVQSPMTIGRNSSCDICIPDGTISDLHSIMYIDGQDIYIKDANSCNGTRINGEVVAGTQQLHTSDILQVGGVELLYDSEAPEFNSYNHTQTSINLDFECSQMLCDDSGYEYEELNTPKQPRRKRKRSSSGMLNINPVKLTSLCISDEDDLYSLVPETIEILSEKTSNLSSLAMEIKENGKRGNLVWKSKKEIYKRQMLLRGFSASDFDQLYEKITAYDTGVNQLPIDMCLNESADFDFLINTDTVVNVPSSRHHHIIPVNKKLCELTPTFMCVPRECESFYRIADFNNPFHFHLANGPVDMFMNRNFLCNGKLETTVKDGKVRVCLGEEGGLKVVRRTKFKEDQSGIVIGKNTLHHTIENSITNTLKHPVRIKLLERLPLAKECFEKSIKVKLNSVTPKWQLQPNPEDLTRQKNIYIWSAEIKPGEEIKFSFDYDIIISSKEQISGGNRREFA